MMTAKTLFSAAVNRLGTRGFQAVSGAKAGSAQRRRRLDFVPDSAAGRYDEQA
jgi:hypothetical protein